MRHRCHANFRGSATGTVLPARHGCTKLHPTCQRQAALKGIQDSVHEPGDRECYCCSGVQQQERHRG